MFRILQEIFRKCPGKFQEMSGKFPGNVNFNREFCISLFGGVLRAMCVFFFVVVRLSYTKTRKPEFWGYCPQNSGFPVFLYKKDEQKRKKNSGCLGQTERAKKRKKPVQDRSRRFQTVPGSFCFVCQSFLYQRKIANAICSLV